MYFEDSCYRLVSDFSDKLNQMSRLVIIIRGLYWDVLVFISQLRKLLRMIGCIVTLRRTLSQKSGCYLKSVDLLHGFECIVL
jgi:hypothetical protein